MKKNSYTSLYLPLVFLYFICVQSTLAATCADTICPDADLCCDDVQRGPTCYDHSINTCPSGSRGSILCGNQENGADFACGLICYDAVEYACCDDTLYGVNDAYIPCTPTPRPTPTTQPPTLPATQAPTHPATQAPTQPAATCANTQCPPGTDTCCEDVTLGPSCYDSNIASCPVGSQGPILCGHQKNGADFACGLICYDIYEYVCCDDVLYGVNDTYIPCASTQAPTQPATQAPTQPATQAPTQPATQAPTQPATQAPTQPATQAPTQPATQAPTQPATQAPTQPATQTPTEAPTQPSTGTGACSGLQCPPGTDACCDDARMGPTCYSSSIASCPTGSKGSILCGFQEHGPDYACGTTCYDRYEYVCCNDTLYGIKDAYIPCAAPGNPTENNGTVVACGGITCDEAGYQCCEDFVNGATCYWPESHTCATSSRGTMLCGTNDIACGASCVDSRIFRCGEDDTPQLLAQQGSANTITVSALLVSAIAIATVAIM